MFGLILCVLVTLAACVNCKHACLSVCCHVCHVKAAVIRQRWSDRQEKDELINHLSHCAAGNRESTSCQENRSGTGPRAPSFTSDRKEKP